MAIRKTGWIGVLIGTAAFGAALGLLAGLLIPQDGLRGAIGDLIGKADKPQDDNPADDPHGDAIELSLAAAKNIDLKFGLAERRLFTRRIRVPAFVREVKGISERTVAAPLAGVISKLNVTPGQVISPGDEICTIQLTGEELAKTQVALLDAERQIEILDEEIARLERIGADGGKAKREKIDKQYEKKRTIAKRDAHMQALLVLGLSPTEVANIRKNRVLHRERVVKVDADFISRSTDGKSRLTISHLNVKPGASVTRGAAICGIADHQFLYLEGEAFARDMGLLLELLEADARVSAVLSTSPGERTTDLKIVHVANEQKDDNHRQQVVHFSIPLNNRVLRRFSGPQERPFLSWKFRPGQRGHIELPADSWSNEFVVPADAVAQDGAAAFVFRRLPQHEHDGELFEMLEPVPVRVLYRNRDHAVIATGEGLSPAHVIAMNNAWLLYLQSSSGGGGHAHHGHSH